jgi:hypothetical protein
LTASVHQLHPELWPSDDPTPASELAALRLLLRAGSAQIEAMEEEIRGLQLELEVAKALEAFGDRGRWVREIERKER